MSYFSQWFFFWASRLPEERQKEINKWVRSLSKAECYMLMDIAEDAREDGRSQEADERDYDETMKDIRKD